MQKNNLDKNKIVDEMVEKNIGCKNWLEWIDDDGAGIDGYCGEDLICDDCLEKEKNRRLK